MSGFVVGLDIGFGNCKVAFGRHRGQEIVRTMPVGAGPRSDLTRGLNGEESRAGHSVLIDKTEWVAGVVPSAFENHVRVTSDSYVRSNQYKALFYAALDEVGVTDIDYLVTGLPVAQYQEGQARIDEVRRVMEGEHYISRDKLVRVREVKVLPQPIGAYYDALGTHKKLQHNRDIYLLVIDPGFYSVDYTTVNRHGLVASNSGSSNLATSVVLDEAAEAFSRTHQHKVSAGRLEEALRQGRMTVNIGVEPKTFKAQLDTAARKASEKVLQEIANKLRLAKFSIDAIVLTGGGASLYESAVRETFSNGRQDHIFLPENSVSANARGFFFAGVGKLEQMEKDAKKVTEASR